MRTPGVGDAAETLKAVADDRAGRVKAALGEAGDCRCTEAGDPTQLQSNRLSLGGCLDRDDKRCLARGPSTPLAAGALTAEIGVIDLDPAGEALGRVSFKRDLLQLVFDLPGGGLRHAKATAQFDAGNALLGLGQVIDRAKP